jgi:hypothetical protein
MISTLDTHELVKDLKASGFTDAQAEAVTRAMRQTQDFSDLATKSDLALQISEIRGEIGNVREEIVAPGLRLIKWVVEVRVTATLAVGGMIWTATQVLLRAPPHL